MVGGGGTAASTPPATALATTAGGAAGAGLGGAGGLVGRLVRKEFEGHGVFGGVVVAVRAAAAGDEAATGDPLFEVEYEDGDVEELTGPELDEVLLPAQDAGGGSSSGEGDGADGAEGSLGGTGGNVAAEVEEDNDADDDDDDDYEDDEEEDGEEDEEDTGVRGEDLDQAIGRGGFQGAASGSAAVFASPAARPIEEMSVEEMMVMNLQRKVREALESGDTGRATALNEQLADLERGLGLRD